MKTSPNHPVLSGGTFGAMSGEKPLYPASVEATHENLVRTLKGMGLDFHETHGKYQGAPERSVIILRPRLDQMKTLGKLFGQESVIYSQGGKHELHYTNGPNQNGVRGTVPGLKPHDWFENPPTDDYTHIPDAGYFRINFDWDQEPSGIKKSVKAIRAAALKKAWPKDEKENEANRHAHAVMEDALLEQGGQKKDQPDFNPAIAPVHFRPGLGHTPKRSSVGKCSFCGEPAFMGSDLCESCNDKSVAGINEMIALRDRQQGDINHWEKPSDRPWYQLNRELNQPRRQAYFGDEELEAAGFKSRGSGVPTPDREAWARSPIMKKRLKKAWPKDEKENEANRTGFRGSKEHAVMEDALSSATGGPVEVPEGGLNPSASAWAKSSDVAAVNARQDYLSGNITPGPSEPGHPTTINSWAGSGTFAGDVVAQQNPNSHVLARAVDTQFWSHPHFYEWHDGHTNHHNPRPWDKQTAIETAHALGLIKNDQAAGVGVQTYAKFALPYGQIQKTPSNLMHYPYQGKLAGIQDLIKKHGYEVYYAGGKYGKPDLAHKNYNTGHLMIYDPTPASGGDFGHRDYTDAWRQIHELAHALTLKDLNNVYGEGGRIGKLGIDRTLNEALRAVHWEHLASHKQRELSKQVGIHISDEDFNKEYNTVMHDAVHRAVTGQFTEPSQEGFVPHSHAVPLSVALDLVRNEAKQMGLSGHHDKLARKSEPKMYEISLEKAWPKDEKENEANRTGFRGSKEHAVMEDALSGASGGPQEVGSQTIPTIYPIQRDNAQNLRVYNAIQFNHGEDEVAGWYRDYRDPSVAHDPSGSWVTEPADVGSKWGEYGAFGSHLLGKEKDKQFWAHPNWNENILDEKGTGVPTPDKEAWAALARSPILKRAKRK